MITIDEKLYITKKVNKVVLKYAEKVVLKKLLKHFSFEKTLKKKKKKVSNLLESMNYYNGDIPPEIQFELIDLIYSFLEKLDTYDTTALYFWAINKLYLRYLEELEYASDDYFDENDSDEVFNFKFGRMLAQKIYDPESTELEDELFQELQNLLITFSTEFDLSLIDKYSIIYIKEAISSYSNYRSSHIVI